MTGVKGESQDKNVPGQDVQRQNGLRLSFKRKNIFMMTPLAL